MLESHDYEYNARELAKAAPKRDTYESCALKMRGPVGESRWVNVSDEQYYRVVNAVSTPPGITYAVQPHDITALTAPMFDACGLECPAMIGADCSGKNGSRLDCPGWSSKFPNAAAEVIYSWGADDRAGGGESGHPWYGLHRTPEDERSADNPMGAGVILTELSTGAVELIVFDSAEELAEVWAKLLHETRECPYEIDGCTGDEMCGQCTDDENEDGDEYDEPTDADEEPGMIR